jgi:hypothetical protein
MNYPAQKAALTKAIKTGDTFTIARTVARAVAAWNGPDGYWPDQWTDWQRAIDDSMPAGSFAPDIAGIYETTTEDGKPLIAFQDN